MSKVYVVIGSRGEYSDRREWVAAVYTDRNAAVSTAETELKKSREADVAHDAWCRRRSNVLSEHGALWWNAQDDRQKELMPIVIERCGPMPRGGSADDYTVVEVETDQWGEWETITERSKS